MKVNLELEFGKKSCYYDFGKWCRMLSLAKFGTQPICNLYGIVLREREEGVERCEECLQELGGE
jgi:hypothetical protein